MMDSYIKLTLLTIISAFIVFIFVILEEKTKFKNIPYKYRQIIYGVTFGLIAVIHTEYGVPISGAQINARDSAVLTAGLFFGAPAGIIAGLIGGIERYVAVAWGIGTYTRVACTIATILAGFYSAFLRKFIFDNKRPNIFIAFCCGLVMEVIHMTLFFFTNANDTERVISLIRICSPLMIPANAVGTMLSCFPFLILSRKDRKENRVLTISQMFQRWLLLVVVLIFSFTTYFTYKLQTTVAEKQTSNYLSLAISDINSTIIESSNNNLLKICHSIIPLIGKQPMDDIRKDFNLTEINIIDKNGFIVDSTFRDYIGYNMRSGSQSEEFLRLLGNTEEYVQEYTQTSFDANVYRKYAGVKTDTGFVQVGYDAEHFQADITSEVIKASKNRHIGTSGFVLVANVDGWIISKPSDVIINSLTEVDFETIRDTDGQLFSRSVFGEDYLAICSFVEGFYIISVMPSAEAFYVRDAAFYANCFMEVIVFAVLFTLISRLINRIVAKKMDDVNISLEKITNGNLEEIVSVRNNKEFVKLSDGINSTVDALKHYIEEAKERINAELEYAKNIQSSSLPHMFPTDKRFDLYALMEPAKEVGGDFYDFSKSGNNAYNFLVADVSGKGIPGAMFMMRAKSVIASLNEMEDSVDAVFTRANERLCIGNEAGMFVTAWLGKINLDTGVLSYANAGHNPPVLMHKDGTCEFIKGKAGFVLAGMDGVVYKKQEIQLEPGDTLFLYTDGVVEANNENKELYGEDRLLKCLEHVGTEVDSQYLCCEVIGSVGRFVKTAEQFDDITVLAFKYIGK